LNIFTIENDGKVRMPTGMSVCEAALERFNNSEEFDIEEQM
jgi:hypothetical protein